MAVCSAAPSACEGGFKFPGDCAAKDLNAPIATLNFDWESWPERVEDIPNVTGYVHSVQSFTAVDGPGVRFLVFLEGCGYRCAFCCNPGDWQQQLSFNILQRASCLACVVPSGNPAHAVGLADNNSAAFAALQIPGT
jgi:hypothetical protein